MGDAVTDLEFISAHTRDAAITPLMDSLQPIDIDRYVERFETYRVTPKEAIQNNYQSTYTFEHDYNDGSYTDFKLDAFIDLTVKTTKTNGTDATAIGDFTGNAYFLEWGIPFFENAKFTINGSVVQTVRNPQYQFMIRFFQQMGKDTPDMDPWFGLYPTNRRCLGGKYIDTATNYYFDDNYDFKTGEFLSGGGIPHPGFLYKPNGMPDDNVNGSLDECYNQNFNGNKRFGLLTYSRELTIRIPIRYLFSCCESLRYVPLQKVQIELKRNTDENVVWSLGRNDGVNAFPKFQITKIEYRFKKTFLAPSDLSVNIMKSMRQDRMIPFTSYQYDEETINFNANRPQPWNYKKTTRGLMAIYHLLTAAAPLRGQNGSDQSRYNFAHMAFQKKIIRYAGRMIESGERENVTPTNLHKTYPGASRNPAYNDNNMWLDWKETVPISKGDLNSSILTHQMFRGVFPIIATRYDTSIVSENGSNYQMDTRPLEAQEDLYFTEDAGADVYDHLVKIVTLIQQEAVMVIRPTNIVKVMNVQ
jgi:hypothetical protein